MLMDDEQVDLELTELGEIGAIQLEDLAEIDLDDRDLINMKHKSTFFSSSGYLSAMARTKYAHLWSEIKRDQSQGSFPPTWKMPELFTMDMKASFDTKGDALKGLMFRSRPKYIHSVGATGKVSFVPNGNAHRFSGMFMGADYGIIRLSSAANPSSSQPLAPGFGLKFLRNNRDSANLVAMFGVDG